MILLLSAVSGPLPMSVPYAYAALAELAIECATIYGRLVWVLYQEWKR